MKKGENQVDFGQFYQRSDAYELLSLIEAGKTEEEKAAEVAAEINFNQMPNFGRVNFYLLEHQVAEYIRAKALEEANAPATGFSRITTGVRNAIGKISGAFQSIRP